MSMGRARRRGLADQGIDGLKFYNGLLMLRDDLGPIDSRAMYAAYSVASERGSAGDYPRRGDG